MTADADQIVKPRPTDEDIGTRALNDALRSGLSILKFVMGLVAITVVFSGICIIEPNEVAVILRFGRPVGVGPDRALKPGLHWACPYPVDEVVRIPAGQSQTVVSTVGWHAASPEQIARGEAPPARGALTPGADGYLISADGNIFHARATLKYRISDPLQYAFSFQDVTNLLRTLLNNALIHAASQYSAEAAIYRDKLGFRDTVLAELSSALSRRSVGIALDPFDVQVVAPVDVRPAFEAVLAAEQERSQRMNEAAAYSSEITLKAEGQAGALRSEGWTLANQIRVTVPAEAKYFEEQLPHYLKNPPLFRRRLLVEAMQAVLTNSQDVFLLPRAFGAEPNHVRLQLNREPGGAARQAPKP